MATVISKEEADAHPNAVLDRAWAGEEIVIEQSGAPKLRLVPVVATSLALGKRQPGRWKGRFEAPPEAFAPLSDEELKDWGF